MWTSRAEEGLCSSANETQEIINPWIARKCGKKEAEKGEKQLRKENKVEESGATQRGHITNLFIFFHLRSIYDVSQALLDHKVTIEIFKTIIKLIFELTIKAYPCKNVFSSFRQ